MANHIKSCFPCATRKGRFTQGNRAKQANSVYVPIYRSGNYDCIGDQTSEFSHLPSNLRSTLEYFDAKHSISYPYDCKEKGTTAIDIFRVPLGNHGLEKIKRAFERKGCKVCSGCGSARPFAIGSGELRKGFYSSLRNERYKANEKAYAIQSVLCLAYGENYPKFIDETFQEALQAIAKENKQALPSNWQKHAVEWFKIADNRKQLGAVTQRVLKSKQEEMLVIQDELRSRFVKKSDVKFGLQLLPYLTYAPVYNEARAQLDRLEKIAELQASGKTDDDIANSAALLPFGLTIKEKVDSADMEHDANLIVPVVSQARGEHTPIVPMPLKQDKAMSEMEWYETQYAIPMDGYNKVGHWPIVGFDAGL